MTMETPEQVTITDDDGLPKIDGETFKKWKLELLQDFPPSNDLADLLVMLRWHAEIDRRGIENPKLPKGLTACERSIHSILTFLKTHNLTQYHGGDVPLRRLNHAFVDIANGKRSKLFEPKERRSGKPPNDTIYETIKGFATRTLSELIEAGDNPEESAKRIAKALKSRRDMRDIRGETIINWREKIMLGEGPGASALAVKHFKEPLTAAFGDTPRARGENLLKQLEKRGAFFG